MAVLGQAHFQFVHSLQQRGNLLALLLHHRFEFGDPFRWRHAPILRLLRKSG